MSHGDEMENLSEADLIEALKELEAEKDRERIEKQILQPTDINLKNIRPTDLKFSTRINPPSEATKKVEAEILVQSNIIRRHVDRYLDSTIETSIFDSKEQEGKESIVKRVKNGELLVPLKIRMEG